MSAQPNDTARSKQSTGPESRGERWAKYGSNVALTVVVAIVLAILVTYIAQANDWKVDTTRGGENSLRPQTLNVLHDLNTDIKLVSLYSKASNAQPAEPGAPKPLDKPAMVADLLDSYKAANRHISVESIDPTDAAKLDALQADLDARYGRGIKQYQAFLSQYGDASKQLLSLLTGQLDQIGTQTVGDNPDENAVAMQGSLREMQKAAQAAQSEVSKGLAKKRPDYHGITEAVRSSLEPISAASKKFAGFVQQVKDNPKVGQGIKDFLTRNQPQFEKIQKLADEQLGKIAALPKLQVDELQQAMAVSQPILVLSPTQWRVLSDDQVWQNKSVRTAGDVKLQPTFAGEQQITAAILGLTMPKKPRVAILRPGGGPLTSPGFPPFQAPGLFSELGERLRMYNFDVVEKDMSGTFAMQAMQRGEMSQPEQSWEQIQDAVWIILDTGGPIQGQEPVGPQLAAHLGHGGSAVILTQPSQGGATEPSGGDPFQSVIKEWGIDLHPDLMAVHDQPPAPPAGANVDPLQDALRRPFFWDLRDYGEAELARPLKNLECLMLVMSPVTTHDVSGYTVQKLLPLPDAPAAPRSWGARDFQDALTNGKAIKFDPNKDMPGPLFGGAVSEKKGGGRLVVIGDIEFAINQIIAMGDEAVEQEEDRQVDRFPGNGELATNSVFWCAKMDQMLALSPAALQVSRISNIGPATLNFWRIGLVLILLPAAVLVSGLGMYFARRD
jgi:hypothetical protein